MDNKKRNTQKDNSRKYDSYKVNSSNPPQKKHVKSQGYYHEKWDSFTKKLRRLMQENPSLPVVVSYRSFDSNDSIDCAIAYVHEKSTGEAEEKIIMIYSVQDNYPGEIRDDDIDIPF